MHPSTAEASRLLLWFSPAFPTGAFGFSHGLEWAVEAGDIGDRASLLAWLGALIEHGGAWSDAILLACAYRAVHAGDGAGFDEAAELASALQSTKERRLEALVQGEAFLKAVETGWPSERLAMFRLRHESALALPIAIGLSAAAERLPLEATLHAFLTGFAQNLVSAAIRLAPIGQSDGLRVLAALEPVLAETTRRAAAATIDEIGTCALRSDIASMRHETQTTRLFRS